MLKLPVDEDIADKRPNFRRKEEGASRVYIVYIEVHRYQNVRALGPGHHVVPLLVVSSDTRMVPACP